MFGYICDDIFKCVNLCFVLQMSQNVVTTLSNGTIVKFPSPSKYTVTKATHSVVQNPSSLLLLTVSFKVFYSM